MPLDNQILGALYEDNLIGRDEEIFIVKYGKKEPSYRLVVAMDESIESFPWSKMDCYNYYKEFREELKTCIHEDELEWECRNWIRQKKTRQDSQN